AEISGTVKVDGLDVNTAGPEELRRLRGESVGLIFQDPMTRLDPLQRIGDHLVETMRAHRPETSGAEARRLAGLALREVGIPLGRARQYPHELSGGMRQRVMIALAVLLRPPVIVADEPTTSLDVLVEAQILDLIDDLRQRLGTALLLVTHDLAVVAERCDRVAVMVAGSVVEVGPATTVFENPRHPYTKILLASRVSLTSERLSPGQDAEHPSAASSSARRHSGCPFASRCPEAIELCYGLAPELEAVEDTLVACHLASPARR
ncbi:MAG: ABC transporter ATP-binding protein, partial [Acidimicrobiia bacterium]